MHRGDGGRGDALLALTRQPTLGHEIPDSERRGHGETSRSWRKLCALRAPVVKSFDLRWSVSEVVSKARTTFDIEQMFSIIEAWRGGERWAQIPV